MSEVIPASTRNHNPGAMYPGKSSRKFGSTRTNIIGGGHQIAEFPDKVSGAAAQFDLLASPTYAGLTVRAAITKWCGANSADSYLFTLKKYAGVFPDMVLTREYVMTPKTGIAFAKAMARQEAGRDYPMTDFEWAQAHARAFPSTPLAAPSEAYLLEARRLVGTKEIAGDDDNAEIMKWYAEVGLPQKHDEVPNCAAFTGASLKRGGMSYKATLLARDYCDYGEELSAPEIGCVGVMKRGSSSWQGHVGFVVAFDEKTVTLLGANQGDMVCEKAYPRKQFIAFRRPIPGLKPVTQTIAQSTSLRRKLAAGIGTVGTGVGVLWDWVAGGLQSAVDATGHVLGLLPGAATHVQTTVGAGTTLAASLGLKLGVTAAVALALVALYYGFKDTLARERVQ